MSDISKLDKTINDLEEQAIVLKQNNKVLANISELCTVIEKSVNEITIANKNFDETKNDIYAALKSLTESVNNLEKQNEKHIDSLITSNKKFLQELENSISSKLERFNSDIQVSIRQERTQLQDALQNNLTSQFNNFELKQKDLFATQTKQISLLKFFLVIIILLCTLLGIKLII